MLEDRSNVVHNLVLQGRKEVSITGVREVKAFDDETVMLDTTKGTLTIKGENLVINNFSADTGDLNLEGDIWALVYSSEQSSKGLLRRILK